MVAATRVRFPDWTVFAFCSDRSLFFFVQGLGVLIGEENFIFFGIKNFDFELAVFTMSSSHAVPSCKNS